MTSARPLARPIAHPLARPIAHPLARPIARSLAGSLAALALATACTSPTAAGEADELDVAALGLPTAAAVTVPDSVIAAYEPDALTLALRVLREGRPPEAQAIEVPAELVAGFRRALAEVHGASALPAAALAARDSVVALYRIHTFPEARQLTVGVDPSVAWTQAWARGSLATGNATVDELVARYGLTLERYYAWPGTPAASLGRTRPLNLTALATRFAPIGGVRYAEPNGYVGDGNDIRARAVPGGWELDYSLGFGDCPAGCISRHVWTFFVDAAGHVEYRGSRGPLPTNARPAPAP